MELIEPSYYRAFRCLAAACPDSCCKEWDIDIDDASARRYRALGGDLGALLRDRLADTPSGTVLLQIGGRCPMWRSDGLCRIQAELGEDALCEICASFPRLRHDYGCFAELGLEMSCPEAARLILTSPYAPDFVVCEPGGDEPDYDLGAMAILRRTRAAFLALLRGGAYTLGELLAIGLYYARAVQSELDGGEPAALDPPRDFTAARALAQPADPDALIDFFSGLEILTPRWRTRLCAPLGGVWCEPLRRLAEYGVSRYWLQAVSDFDLIGRVKMVAASCLLVKLLGGDPIATAQLYSKEIENDPDNVNAILDAACTSPIFSDGNLLGLLLDLRKTAQ